MTYAAVVVRVNVLRDFTYPGEATPLDVVNVHGAVGGEGHPRMAGCASRAMASQPDSLAGMIRYQGRLEGRLDADMYRTETAFE
jgi:hypothetical protein